MVDIDDTNVERGPGVCPVITMSQKHGINSDTVAVYRVRWVPYEHAPMMERFFFNKKDAEELSGRLLDGAIMLGMLSFKQPMVTRVTVE
jgi:hypothetical protein